MYIFLFTFYFLLNKDYRVAYFLQQGYREGLIKGKDRKLQEGFDQGYLSGFKQSQNSAEMKGFLSAVMLHNIRNLELNEKLKTILADM